MPLSSAAEFLTLKKSNSTVFMFIQQLVDKFQVLQVGLSSEPTTNSGIEGTGVHHRLGFTDRHWTW